jgi:predicted nucleic acid-binding protein
VIVVDASAAVLALVNAGEARRRLQVEELHAPALVDSEVVHVIRRQERAGMLGPAEASRVIDTWRRLGVRRHSAQGQIDRMWALRYNLTGYDATYVALAEALGCELVTADRRLTGTPKVGCTMTLVTS